LEIAQRLAEEFKVGEATICRDGKFTTAVDSIAENCGEKAGKRSWLGTLA